MSNSNQTRTHPDWQRASARVEAAHLAGFRGGAEKAIGGKVLKDGRIDTVVGMSANLFYSIGIPFCILVPKKFASANEVLFINASGPEHFVEDKRQKQLCEEHVAKIVETYQLRKEKDRYSRRVEMDEIEKNDLNLNVSSHVSTATAEAAIQAQCLPE